MKAAKYLILFIPLFIYSCGGSSSSSGQNPSINEAYAPYGQWPLNNVDIVNSGVVTSDKLINVNNVSSLKPLFLINLGKDAVMSTPTIADGIVYFATGFGVVKAVDGKTGNVRWSTQLAVNGRAETFAASPILTKTKLFIAQDYMYALDRKTGAILWNTPVYQAPNIPACSNYDTSGINGAHLAFAGDKVVYTFGFLDEEAAIAPPQYECEHGQIVAFNQDTGNVDWRQDLTLVNGIQYGGGSGGFGLSGVDPRRHVLYIGTSNSYAPPSSPYADSLLAINYDNGDIVWAHQFYSNDISSILYSTGGLGSSDLDVRGHPQLFSMKINNKMTDFVAETGKDGVLSIFNRDQPSFQAKPLAQVQLAPGSSLGGGIALNPVLKDGILYVTISYTLQNGVPVSVDYLEDKIGEAALFVGITNIMAIDMKKLITYGMNNPTDKPLCYGNLIPPLCQGQLPSDQGIVIYNKPLGVGLALNSSGLAYDNGVIYFPSFAGYLIAINASDGSIITKLGVAPSATPLFGILNYNVIGGGVSINDGVVYVPYGIYYYGQGIGEGGIAAFTVAN